MLKTETDNAKRINLSGFYRFLQKQYRFPEHRLRGIIACTGVILNKVQNLTMSRSDLERIRAYIKSIGLTGETINFYITSFVFYIMYLERANDSRA
jgi:RAB protein geranylgeranyltransferase component A